MANALKNFRHYPYNSRYESFPYFYDNDMGRYYYGLTSWLKNDIPSVLYKVEDGDTYDSIALNYYGSSLYYWIVCDFNRITDPFTQPTPGTGLRLPALSAVSFIHG